MLLLEELFVGDCRKIGGLVDDRRLVDLFRHWDGVVNRRRLDRLTLNHGLDCRTTSVTADDTTYPSHGCGGALLVDLGTQVGTAAVYISNISPVLMDCPLLLQFLLVFR